MNSRINSLHGIRQGLIVCCLVSAWGLALCNALAQPFGDGTWQAQGPGPIIFGQTENVTPDNEVVGAIHTLLTHPTDPDIIYAGAVNGGIWKTTNATDGQPTWTPLTDDLPSLSVGAMAFDSADDTFQTIYAGTGRFSSIRREGGEPIGLVKTTDGGATWSTLDGGGRLFDKNISGLAVKGNQIVVSVNAAFFFTAPEPGIFRSNDGGQTFTSISTGDGSSSGLPAGASNDLAQDPSDPDRLFTSVIFAEGVGGTSGLYRSDNFGASWVKVSNAAIEALFLDDDGNNRISNVEFAVGQSNNVYAAVVARGRLDGLFRSANGGGNWTAMDLPTTTEDGIDVGIHPGGQGGIHLSIAADPSNASIVYVGGDRQPRLNEFSDNDEVNGFPNSIGAQNFSGRLFRGDAALPSGSQWTPLTHSGTQSNSSPHADSREMAFDANGDLIETDDGGIYRRTQPQSNTGDWFSLNGDLQSTEYHGVAYDTVSNIIFGGAQDVGTSSQLPAFGQTFETLAQGDGGDPGVDDISSSEQSTRFISFQNFSSLRRLVFDDSNTFQSLVFPALNVLAGGDEISAQFYTPLVINSQNGNRLLIGGGNSLYESLDQGDTVSEIAAGWRANAFVGDPLVYGVPGNADLIYGAGTIDADPDPDNKDREQRILRRTGEPGSSFDELEAPSSDTVVDLAVAPDQPSLLFAMSRTEVFLSDNAGDSWTNVTGNLQSLEPSVLRSMSFVPASDDAVIVGTNRGAFFATAGGGFSNWNAFGDGLPNAPLFELEYDAADDVLLAGLLGRGAWIISPVAGVDPDLLFEDSFESQL